MFGHLYNPFYSYFACRLCVDSNCRPLAKKTTSLPFSPHHWLAPFTKQEVGPFHKNVFKIYNFFIESVRVGGRCSIFWYSCVNWVERNSGQQMASNQRRPPMFKTKKSQWTEVSVTRLGDLLHFGQLFMACGKNYFVQIAHILGNFLQRF